MITKWGVKNFKSILEADLELAPFTVFTGVNSSGKSSFLQSIALLAQSERTVDKQPITFNGNLAKLGGFNSIHCNKALDHWPDYNNVGISFSVSPKSAKLGKDKSICFELEFGNKKTEETENPSILFLRMGIKNENAEQDNENFIEYWDKSLKNDGEVKRSEIFFSSSSFLPQNFYYIISRAVDLFIELISFPVKDEPGYGVNAKYGYLFTLEKDRRMDDLYIMGLINIAKTASDFMHELNFILNNKIIANKIDDGITEPINEKEIEEIINENGNFNEDNWLYGLDFWFKGFLKLDEHEKKEVLNNFKEESFRNSIKKIIYLKNTNETKAWQSLEASSLLNEALNYLHDFFSSDGNYPCINYLGPLREEPQWEYNDKVENYKNYIKSKKDQWMRNIGRKGENTMDVIKYFLRNRHIKIKNYYSPRFFEDPDYKPEEKGFAEGLIEWLNYFELADDFINIDLGKDGIILFKMVIDGQEFSLPQLGTGVSQILPILVMCLAAYENSSLPIQEPEQNLHPKLQSKLADFLILESISGRQCLIETHSEYIIEQLRYRILMLSDRFIEFDNKRKRLHELTKLYFVTNNDGGSFFKDIEINEYAAPDEWPEDFFDESHKISRKIMKEAIKKMRSKKQDG